MLLAIANNPHTKNPKKLYEQLRAEKNRKMSYNEDKQEINRLRQALQGSKRIKQF